jgi:hypothetical protein
VIYFRAGHSQHAWPNVSGHSAHDAKLTSFETLGGLHRRKERCWIPASSVLAIEACRPVSPFLPMILAAKQQAKTHRGERQKRLCPRNAVGDYLAHGAMVVARHLSMAQID